MNDKSRNKPTNKIRGIKATDITYNEQSGSQKVLGPIVGQLTNLGQVPAASTPMNHSIQNGDLIALYNTNATTAFFAAENAAIPAAPTAATGICLRPNDYTIIALKDGDAFFRASGAGVIAYIVEDYSFIQ